MMDDQHLRDLLASAMAHQASSPMQAGSKSNIGSNGSNNMFLSSLTKGNPATSPSASVSGGGAPGLTILRKASAASPQVPVADVQLAKYINLTSIII